MPPHEWRPILAKATDERRNGLFEFQVPRSHAAVAQESRSSGAGERRAAKAFLELLVGSDVEDLCYLQVWPGAGIGGELRPAATRCLAFVVRTDLLADVAAEGPVAHRTAQFAWDLALVLDGQVRDAQPRVYHAGGFYRAGRAGGQAAGTLAAGACAVR